MKVRDIMTGGPERCTAGTDLAAAAMVMWRNDCGVVPVVSDFGEKAVGVITDRDICMAVATRHRRAEEIRVEEVMSGRLHAVHPADDVHTALEMMRAHQVRRLPVVNGDGVLEGVLSINDLILQARPAGHRLHAQLAYEEVMETLAAICRHQRAAAPASRAGERRDAPEPVRTPADEVAVNVT